MKLQVSVAARDRGFSKALQRIDARLTPLCSAFELVELAHPIHEAVLVLITDDKAQNFLEEVPNRDGYFQVVAGCGQCVSDDKLTVEVFNILRRSVKLCPFTTPDHETLEALFDEFQPFPESPNASS